MHTRPSRGISPLPDRAHVSDLREHTFVFFCPRLQLFFLSQSSPSWGCRRIILIFLCYTWVLVVAQMPRRECQMKRLFRQMMAPGMIVLRVVMCRCFVWGGVLRMCVLRKPSGMGPGLFAKARVAGVIVTTLRAILHPFDKARLKLIS